MRDYIVYKTQGNIRVSREFSSEYQQVKGLCDILATGLTALEALDVVVEELKAYKKFHEEEGNIK